MEICDRVSSIAHVVGRFPRAVRFTEPDPVHEVKDLALHDFGIEDRGHLMLTLAVHHDRRRRRHDTARERIGIVWLQEADVEDGMDFDGGRQLQMVSRCPNLANDRERAQTTDIQF